MCWGLLVDAMTNLFPFPPESERTTVSCELSALWHLLPGIVGNTGEILSTLSNKGWLDIAGVCPELIAGGGNSNLGLLLSGMLSEVLGAGVGSPAKTQVSSSSITDEGTDLGDRRRLWLADGNSNLLPGNDSV